MIPRDAIQAYLRQVLGQSAELVEVQALGAEAHDTGISSLLRLEVQLRGERKSLILRRSAPSGYGAELAFDRASAVLQAATIYNRIPQHPRALDLAVVGPEGSLHRIPGHGEFVLLQEYAAGDLYLRSLMRALAAHEVSALEVRRAEALAEYLVALHSERCEDVHLYRRSLRDMVAGGVGVMGVLGGYSSALREAHHPRLGRILQDVIALAWELERHTGRLCRIHGDFHPLNILFSEDAEFAVIDASGIGWGDAAFDVGTLLINYYALYNRADGLSTDSGRRLATRFLETYVERCPDPEGLYRALPLPLARGALIMATTDFFPDRSAAERERLIRLAGDILSAGVFTPSLFA